MDISTSTRKVDSAGVREVLGDVCERLKRVGVDSPVLDAELMLAHAMGTSRTNLLTHPEIMPSNEQLAQFRELAGLRGKRVPLAYVLGCKEFYSISLEVTPAALIPRPETETLVDATLRLLSGTPRPMIADLGVGSGAIAISLVTSLPDAHVVATESSPAALEVARRNVLRHHVEHQVDLLHGDLFDPLEGQSFNAVVSNPPYVPTAEIAGLQPEIARHEPREALDGGPDGLDYYRRIIPAAPACLKRRGVLLVEVGAGQSAEVASLFRRSGYTDVGTIRDYSDVERVVLGRKPVDC